MFLKYEERGPFNREDRSELEYLYFSKRKIYKKHKIDFNIIFFSVIKTWL